MPNIFISYRRDDSPANARLLHDRLQEAFPQHSVFMDVNKIRLGDEWREVLRDRIRSAEFMLVVIGRNWLDLRDEQGRRRLDDEADFVRWEIAEALRLGKTIVPLQVDGAALPTTAELPVDIARLPEFQGLTLSHLKFEDDVQTLIARLEGDQNTGDVVQRLRQRLRMGRVSAGVAAVVVVLATGFAWVNLFDLLGLDTRTANFTMLIGDVLDEPPLSDELLLVGIEPTEQETQRLSPDRRAQYAQLIDMAVEQGAKRIAFDIVLVGSSANDEKLKEAIRNASAQGVPVAFGFNSLERGQPRLPPGFVEAGAAAGLTCVGERLGNVTYGNLLLQSEQRLYGSFAFHAALAPLEIDQLPIEASPRRYRTQSGDTALVPFSVRETVSVADADCPARTPGSTFARLIVPLSHKERWRDPVRRVAIEDLLSKGPSTTSRLRGKVVLVGATHNRDKLKTRLDGTPTRFGFEFHADVINALLTDRVVQPVDFGTQWWFAVVTIGIAVAWRRARLGKPRRGDAIVLVVLCAMLVAVAVVLYSRFGWLVDSLYFLGALLVTWWLLARLERRWGHANR